MKKLFGLLFIALAVLQSCKQSSEGPVTLQLNFKKGDTYTVVSKIDANAGGMSLNTETEMKVTIDDVTDNKNFVCTGDVLAMKVKSEMLGEKEEYNSAKSVDQMDETEREMHEEFEKVLNTNITFTTNNRGELVKKPAYAGGETMSAEELPVDMENLFLVFPDKPIKVGDTWKGEKTNPLTEAKSSLTYKVKTITAKEVQIDITAEIDAPVSGMAASAANGQYVIDRATGKLIKYSMGMEMPGMLGGGGGKASYTITTK